MTARATARKEAIDESPFWERWWLDISWKPYRVAMTVFSDVEVANYDALDQRYSSRRSHEGNLWGRARAGRTPLTWFIAWSLGFRHERDRNPDDDAAAPTDACRKNRRACDGSCALQSIDGLLRQAHAAQGVYEPADLAEITAAQDRARAGVGITVEELRARRARRWSEG